MELLENSSALLSKLYKDNTGFAVYESDGLVVVSGTDKFLDWGYNLNLRTNYLGYHKGFYMAATIVQQCVRSHSYVVVGHSLGAAAASILAETDKRCLYAVGISTPNYTKKKTDKANVIHIGSRFDPVYNVPINYRKNGSVIKVPGRTHNHELVIARYLKQHPTTQLLKF